jgi:nicotinamide-nucleotide amidase
MHEESRLRIRKRFESAGREVPEGPEQRNALVPQGAEVLPNDFGLAPGICIEKNGKILIMLPGPPHEMQPMFKNYAAKFLRRKTDCVFVSRTLKIVGMGESAAETEWRDLIDAQTNPTIAPYAKVGEVHIRVTASAETEAEAHALITPVADEIYTRMNPRVYGEDEQALAEIVLDKMKAGKYTLAVAESCTGGLVASNLVAIAGSSEVFREGFVTYSNEAKIARLNVPEDIINTHGAVSEEVAKSMAEGAARAAGTSIGLSTTGIAGPSGGTDEKPVGLVYIGLYIEGHGTVVSKHNTIGNRNEVRTRSAILALDLLRRNLTEGA